MEFNIMINGHIAELELKGELVASAVQQFKTRISELIGKNIVYILLDIGTVHFMDSLGLKACMETHKMLKDKNGMLVCVKPGETVSKVFRITGADGKLNIAATKQDGIKVLHERMSGNIKE